MVYMMGQASTAELEYLYRDLDGDFSKVVALDMSRDDGITPDVGRMVYVGRLIDGTHLPTKVEVGGPKRSLPDILHFHSMPLVNKAFKNELEAREPNTHQLFPVTLYWSDGIEAGRRYFLVIGNRLDSVDATRTTMERGKVLYTRSKTGSNELVFSRAKIGNATIWQDKHLVSKPLISDDFAQWLTEAGITGIVLTQYDQS